LVLHSSTIAMMHGPINISLSFYSKDHSFSTTNHKRSRYIRFIQLFLKNRSHLKILRIRSAKYTKFRT